MNGSREVIALAVRSGMFVNPIFADDLYAECKFF